MAITVAQFKAKFPEFGGTDGDVIQLAIDEADCFIGDTAWGSFKDLGRLYMTAHILAMSAAQGGGGVGPITSKSVDDVSVGYATPTLLSRSTLGSTSYGARFLETQSRVFVPRCL